MGETTQRYSLMVSHPELGDRAFGLEVGGTYYLGSLPENDIPLPVKDVSRRHAVLKVNDGVFQITDLKSKNGTFLDGAPVGSCSFRCGDRVRLSSALLVVVEEPGDRRKPTGAHEALPSGSGEQDVEDTERHRAVLDANDLVDLLVRVRAALESHSLSAPVEWAVRRLGLEGAMVLYGAESGVSLVASAGDLGGLLSDSRALRGLVARGASSELVQVDEHGQRLVLAQLARGHLLVIRHSDQVPDVAEVRAAVVAANILLDGLQSYGPARPDDSGGGRDIV